MLCIRFVYFATDTSPGGILYETAEVEEPPIYEMMMRCRHRRKQGTRALHVDELRSRDVRNGRADARLVL